MNKDARFFLACVIAGLGAGAILGLATYLWTGVAIHFHGVAL